MNILPLIAVFFLLCMPPAVAENRTPSSAGGGAKSARVFSTAPANKPGGQKWRIAYVEGGDYLEYPKNLKAIARGLQNLGWIALPETVPDELAGEALWHFLSKNAQSSHIEFVADAYWRPGNFDASLRPAMRYSIQKRLDERKDIDLVIAMGTWAGQDMVELGVPVPTVVASTNDAVGAGIAKSAADSGADNLHARVYPDRYRQQIRLFHDIIHFKRLGVIYENTPEGRTYATLDTLDEMAVALGFEVVPCETPFSGLDQAQIEERALACYERLARQADAIYITAHRGTGSKESTRKLAALLRKAKVPSFSMEGSDDVEKGILMSLAQSDVSFAGQFHAETIARVFNGAKPRQLSQIWVDPTKIALNLKTTRMIGFDPPVDILLAADEVYEAE